VVAWPVSTARLTCVHPVPGPFRAVVLAVEAKSSITSPAMTGAGTRAENVVLFPLTADCPTYVIGDGSAGGGGGSSSPPPSRFSFSSPTSFRSWWPTPPGRSLLLSWQMKTPFGKAGPRSAVDAVTPSVRSQSSEDAPFATLKVFTKSFPGPRL
jgi:hypothetical protein